MKDVVIGLDVSSSKVGLAIIDLKQNLLHYEVVKLCSKKDLEDRCIDLESVIQKLNGQSHQNYNIKNVFIESPFIMFSGGKTTAMTMAKLQRFNGMVCYMIRRTIGINPALIAANKARGLIGLKIKRGEDTKKKIIEWVENRFSKTFKYELTRYGNPKPGTDDMADAVVVALAGLIQNKT